MLRRLAVTSSQRHDLSLHNRGEAPPSACHGRHRCVNFVKELKPRVGAVRQKGAGSKAGDGTYMHDSTGCGNGEDQAVLHVDE